MDALTGLLDSPRARGAFLLRSVLDPPWALRITDRAPVSLMAMLRGTAWVLPDAGDAVRVGPGDLVVLRGPDAYTVADDPATAPQIVIHPGQRCTTPTGEPLTLARDLGVRTWGTDPDGGSVVLSGTYETAGEVSRRLLDALPPVAVLGAAEFSTPLLPMLADEVARDAPGQEVVLDRMLDLLLITVLRAWFSRSEAHAPAWYRAHSDPVVGQAIRMLQNDPARPWTVGALAGELG